MSSMMAHSVQKCDKSSTPERPMRDKHWCSDAMHTYVRVCAHLCNCSCGIFHTHDVAYQAIHTYTFIKGTRTYVYQRYTCTHVLKVHIHTCIKIYQAHEEKMREEHERKEAMLRGNPLLAGASSFGVKRRYVDPCASVSSSTWRCA
jgi:hypothetical protein